MSGVTAQKSGVTLVSFKFVLKWTLKAKQLNSLPVRSDVYLFKTAQDLRFYLEFTELKKSFFFPFSLCIKGSKLWSFEIEYAFIVGKETAFKLMEYNPLSFLCTYSSSYFPDEEDVTMHFVINAFPVPAALSKEEDAFLQESQNMVEVVQDVSYPTDYTNEKVINFFRKGDIPNLTVDTAIKIIRESKIHKCESLRILCIEYLMNNIEASSISRISRVAMDCGITRLERECLGRIAGGYYTIE